MKKTYQLYPILVKMGACDLALEIVKSEGCSSAEELWNRCLQLGRDNWIEWLISQILYEDPRTGYSLSHEMETLRRRPAWDGPPEKEFYDRLYGADWYMKKEALDEDTRLAVQRWLLRFGELNDCLVEVPT